MAVLAAAWLAPAALAQDLESAVDAFWTADSPDELDVAVEAVLALDGVESVTVRLLSRIGRPVDRPVAAQVEVAGEPDPVTLHEVRRRLAAAVADWRGASQRLVEGRYELV